MKRAHTAAVGRPCAAAPPSLPSSHTGVQRSADKDCVVFLDPSCMHVRVKNWTEFSAVFILLGFQLLQSYHY